jgi:hypothetical protein
MRGAMLLVAVLGAVGIGAAHGKECQGVSFPDRLQIDGTRLALNGLGLRLATIFRVKVYVAALYVAKPANEARAILAGNTPVRLIMHFVRDVSAQDLVNGWEEAFAKNAKEQTAALKDRIGTLNAWMSDVKTGQRLTFTIKPGAGVQVDFNGAVMGTIPGDDFAKALLSIWLGDPPNRELKEGLLGAACG